MYIMGPLPYHMYQPHFNIVGNYLTFVFVNLLSSRLALMSWGFLFFSFLFFILFLFLFFSIKLT